MLRRHLSLAAVITVCSSCAASERTPPTNIEHTFADAFVRKTFISTSGSSEVLLETPLYTRGDEPGPIRALVVVDESGAERTDLVSTLERKLIDFALHPSGERTALFASDEGFTLVRLDADGAVIGETLIVDPEFLTDPPVRAGMPATLPVSIYSYDCGRVAAFGEDVIAATRTGRHSVIAYRFAFGETGFSSSFRTLVVPPHGHLPVGLNGGSYDTFGQVANPYAVYLDVDENGLTYIGTTHGTSGIGFVHAHELVFGEVLVGDPDRTDAYVTRIDADGTRLGTTVVTTELVDEIYGLRAVHGAAYVLGRNEIWNEQGTGHDALVARIDGATGAVDIQALDIHLGDIAFDAVELADGRLVVLGASGYYQNPHGASISDTAAPFARVLGPNGETHDLTLPNTERQDIAYWARVMPDGRLVVGGMNDGPGTHSADSDLTLLRARGFLTTVAIDPVSE